MGQRCVSSKGEALEASEVKAKIYLRLISTTLLRFVRGIEVRFVALMFVSVIVLNIASNEAPAQQRAKQTLLEDPMFGLSYDYTKITYEQFSKSVAHLCRLEKGGKYWLFAHTHRKSGDYYVVMGVVPGQSGDSLGIALWVRDPECDAEDSLWMQSGFSPAEGYTSIPYSGELPGMGAQKACNNGDCHYVLRSAEEEAILRDLVRDAISRGIQVWGEERFRKEACQSAPLKDRNSPTPIAQKALAEFCVSK